MQTEQIVALSSSLVAAVSTILILLTLLEMRAQRKASQRPALCIKTDVPFTIFYRTGNYVGVHPIRLCDASIDPLMLQGPESLTFGSLHLPLSNIGLAAAKSVRIEWSIDLHALTETIGLIDPAEKASFSQSGDFYHIALPRHGISSTYNATLINSMTIDYLLPMGTTGEAKRVPIPEYYLAAIVVLAALLVESNDYKKEYGLFQKLPHLNIKINYKDLENRQYRQQLSFQPFITDWVTAKLDMPRRKGKPIASRLLGGVIQIAGSRSLSRTL
jgi:hypothetical protein